MKNARFEYTLKRHEKFRKSLNGPKGLINLNSFWMEPYSWGGGLIRGVLQQRGKLILPLEFSLSMPCLFSFFHSPPNSSLNNWLVSRFVNPQDIERQGALFDGMAYSKC